jgi:hypothetical protein
VLLSAVTWSEMYKGARTPSGKSPAGTSEQLGLGAADDDDDSEVEEIVEVVGSGSGGSVVVCVNGNLSVELSVLLDVGTGGTESEDTSVEVTTSGVKGSSDVGSTDGKDSVRTDMVLPPGSVEMGNKPVVGGGGICPEEDPTGTIVPGSVAVGSSGFGGTSEPRVVTTNRLLNGGGLGITPDEGNIPGGYDCVEPSAGLGNLSVGTCPGGSVSFGPGTSEIPFALFLSSSSPGGPRFEPLPRSTALSKRIGLPSGRGTHAVGSQSV